jgi:DNA-directed RNA polymerase II subunit RPB3
MDIESVGSMPLDEIMQQGIKYLQEKLAAVIKTFDDSGAAPNAVPADDGFDDGVRSPGQVDYNIGAIGAAAPGGYDTPFGAGNAAPDNRAPYAGFGGSTPYAANDGWS